MTRPTITLDIETQPTEQALEMAPPEDWLAAPGNYSKPESIAAYREKQLAAWPQEITKIASLDWRLGKIAAIGWHVPDSEPVVHCSPSEGFMLAKFWETVADLSNLQLVGFGLAGFDLPWILGRSALLRIAPTRKFNGNRYDASRSDIIDWQDILAGHDSSKKTGWKLSRYAEVFQLPPTIGTGAEVADWLAAGETGKVIEHCRADLVTTSALHRLFAPVYL